jgi:outer membrane protein OmpA-like peptidoglycan-associated protein
MMALRYLVWLTVMTFLMSPDMLLAQSRLCRGSLGDNIFTEGDFGSGPQNAPFDDPGLAPGYMYSIYTPLRDGQYTITNSLARGGDWPSWLRIGDNSDDRYGYMMVVNASYEPGIFYEKVIDGVCDNTTYEFSADVINVIRREEHGHLYPDVSFLIDGIERYSTGWILQDERWRKVGFTFTTGPGQTEVRLTLRNNAAGGYGNDIALDNISFRACGPMATIHTIYPGVMCEDSEAPVLSVDVWDGSQRVVQWQMSGDDGKTWKDIRGATSIRHEVKKLAPGRYQFRFAHAASAAQLKSAKCRSVSDVFQLEVKPAIIRRSATIDAGDVYRLAGKGYRTSGSYRAIYQNTTGCDSTVIVQLTVRGDQLSADVLATEATCFGARDGEARVSGQEGGAAPFSYRWSNGGRGRRVQGLAAGGYIVTITDSRGVTLVKEVVVEQPGKLQAEVIAEQGQASVAITGGTEPCRYVWSDGSTAALVHRPRAGRLSVTVTDSRGCTAYGYVDIPVPDGTSSGSSVPAFTMETLGSGNAVRMDRVQFRADSSSIDATSLPTLRALLHFLKEHPGITVEIGGHTNGLPDHAYCDSLSTTRAKSIADWLIQNGAQGVRVRYKGYGKRQPIATNATVDGRRKNQRVEVRVVEQ